MTCQICLDGSWTSAGAKVGLYLAGADHRLKLFDQPGVVGHVENAGPVERDTPVEQDHHFHDGPAVLLAGVLRLGEQPEGLRDANMDSSLKRGLQFHRRVRPALHQVVEPRILQGEADVGSNILVGGGCGLELMAETQEPLLGDRVQQTLAVAERIIERAMRDADGICNAAQAQRFMPVRYDQIQRGEDRFGTEVSMTIGFARRSGSHGSQFVLSNVHAGHDASKTV